MNEMNPAAGIRQQNKQAELGRREDRGASQQQMLATMLTLFQQGKISEQQLDAQMKIAGERIHAERDMNAANLSTQKDINAATLASNEKIAGQAHSLASDQANFQKAMLMFATKRNLMDEMGSGNNDPTTGAIDQTELRRLETERRGSLSAAFDASKNADTMEKFMQNLVTLQEKASNDMKAVLTNALSARQAAVNPGKELLDPSAPPLKDANGLIGPLQRNGIFGKKDPTPYATALSAVAEIQANPMNPPPKAVEKLHKILNGDGKGDPGLGEDAVFNLVETIHTMENDAYAAGGEQLASGADKLLAGAAGSPASIAGSAQTAQQKGDVLRSIRLTIESQHPYAANKLSYMKTRNEAFQRYSSNLKPGQFINSEELWKDFDAVMTGGGQEKRIEVARGLAAVPGQNPSVQYWLDKLNAGRAEFDTFKKSPEFAKSVEDARQTAFREVDVQKSKENQILNAYEQWNTANTRLEMARTGGLFDGLDPEHSKALTDIYQKKSDELAAKLESLGVSPGQRPQLTALPELEKQITRKQSEASNKMMQAQTQQEMGELRGQFSEQLQNRPMLQPGPVNPAVQQGMTGPARSPAPPPSARTGGPQGAPISGPASASPTMQGAPPPAPAPAPTPWGWDPIAVQQAAGGGV